MTDFTTAHLAAQFSGMLGRTVKLVPTKGPVECLVIDHVELPSEN